MLLLFFGLFVCLGYGQLGKAKSGVKEILTLIVFKLCDLGEIPTSLTLSFSQCLCYDLGSASSWSPECMLTIFNFCDLEI